MVKLVFTLRRRKDMTRAEFQRYWREEHAALVARHADTLRVKRYVQVHSRDTDLDEAISAQRGTPLRHFDGVAELWWESMDDLMAAYGSEEGQAASQELLEDERRFIDLAASPLWLGEENVVVA